MFLRVVANPAWSRGRDAGMSKPRLLEPGTCEISRLWMGLGVVWVSGVAGREEGLLSGGGVLEAERRG